MLDRRVDFSLLSGFFQSGILENNAIGAASCDRERLHFFLKLGLGLQDRFTCPNTNYSPKTPIFPALHHLLSKTTHHATT